jgi:glycosyltransferase involved in cell wall biosynthesis
MVMHDAAAALGICRSVWDRGQSPLGRPKRILMVSARYFPFIGGIETHIHEVGTRLVAGGHSVTVLTTDPSGKYPAQENVSGMHVSRVKAWPERGDLYFAPGIFTRLAKGDWDVVHIQGYHTFVAPLALIAAIQQDIPFVITFHSGGHSSRLRQAMRGVQHGLLRPLISRARQLIAVSQFEAEFFSRRMRLPRERFSVIPNGARATCAIRRRTREKSPIVVSIGRLERYKGHHRAIEAFPELLRRLPDARLLVLGQGIYERQLRSLVQKLALEEHVSIGSIPPNERQRIADLLSGAGLMVLLSEYEAHPIAVMEALSLGCPVLVSDTSGLRELAEKGHCRCIPLNASRKELAEAMADELQNRREMPETSLPDWDRCTDALSRVYETVVNGEY